MEILGYTLLPHQIESDLESALRRIASGRALLFLGAGFSVGAKNVDDEEPPTARTLAHKISSLAGIPEDDDLKYASEYCLRNGHAKRLMRFLSHKFTIKEATKAHKSVSRAPWRRVYTTNYDNCFELAARNAGRPVVGLTTIDAVDEYVKRKDICIHINGYIDRLTEESLNADFKLARSSYVAPDSFVNSAWSYTFKRDIETCSAIIFIGYSLYDIDIEKILFTSPTFKLKFCTFGSVSI
jgi:hypothetical protein